MNLGGLLGVMDVVRSSDHTTPVKIHMVPDIRLRIFVPYMEKIVPENEHRVPSNRNTNRTVEEIRHTDDLFRTLLLVHNLTQNLMYPSV